MSNRPIEAHNDRDGNSRGSYCPYQSSWMSHWTQAASKQKSILNPHSSTFSAEPTFAGSKQNQSVSVINCGSSKFHSGKGKETEAQVAGLLNGRSTNLVPDKSDYESFWSFSLSREKRNTMTAQTEQGSWSAMTSNHRKSSLAGDLRPSLGRCKTSHLSSENIPLAVSQCSEEENVADLASAAIRRKEMHKDVTMGFSASEACVSGSNQGVRPLDMGNVFETRRICPTVDISRGSPSMFSQTAHHFLFAEKTGIDLPKRQQMIQPFVSFPDDDEEKTGGSDAKTTQFDTSEASAETSTMDMGVSLNKNVSPGLAYSEPIKQHIGLVACDDLQRDDFLGKRLKASINKNHPFLPRFPCEQSFTKEIEPSSSKMQGLHTCHLSDGVGQSSRSKYDQSQDLRSLTEPSIRWAKRLKPSNSNCLGLGTKSSKMEEPTSHEKQRNIIFSKIIGSSQTYSRHEGTAGSDENVNPSSPSKKNQDLTLCCYSWIGRWCRNPSRARKLPVKSPSVVIGEPNGSNLAFNELVKGQLPSVAAMALVGKSLNGLWRCELTRRGALVIWNTKKY